MPIKLGANPLCWMNTDFPHLGEEVTVQKCLSDIANIGYAGVELEDPFKKAWNDLPDLLQTCNLSCIGKWLSTFILNNGIDNEMKRLKEHVDMLERLNGDVVILAECSRSVHQKQTTSLADRPIINASEWKQLCDGLEQMAQYVKDRGLYSAYHHHIGTVVQNEKEINRLLENTESLGLLFDTGHLEYAGYDSLKVLENTLSRITHVHCKAVRPTILSKKVQEKSSFFSAVIDGVFTVPGDQESENKIDFEEIIDKLIANNYNGWIVMEAEQDPNQADPYTYAKMGFDTLHNLLKN